MYWLAVTFVAGIALGLLMGRDKPVDSATPASTSRSTTAAAGPTRSIIRVAPAMPAAATPPPPPVHLAPASAAPPAAAATMDLPVEASSSRQPIDPGSVFTTQFALAAKSGLKDDLAEAHAALEHEAHDYSWSYGTEAEIQNSLAVETSMGNFKLEHLECRTSMCEIRLTARGEQQVTALRKWNEVPHTTPLATGLMMTNGAFITENDSTEALIILRKPQAPAAQKR